MILLQLIDTNWNLTRKILYGWKYLVENTKACWFLKADIDQYVKVKNLETFLKGNFNSHQYVVDARECQVTQRRSEMG